MGRRRGVEHECLMIIRYSKILAVVNMQQLVPHVLSQVWWGVDRWNRWKTWQQNREKTWSSMSIGVPTAICVYVFLHANLCRLWIIRILPHSRPVKGQWRALHTHPAFHWMTCPLAVWFPWISWSNWYSMGRKTTLKPNLPSSKYMIYFWSIITSYISYNYTHMHI